MHSGGRVFVRRDSGLLIAVEILAYLNNLSNENSAWIGGIVTYNEKFREKVNKLPA